jgi:hypothetical protein
LHQRHQLLVQRHAHGCEGVVVDPGAELQHSRPASPAWSLCMRRGGSTTDHGKMHCQSCARTCVRVSRASQQPCHQHHPPRLPSPVLQQSPAAPAASTVQGAHPTPPCEQHTAGTTAIQQAVSALRSHSLRAGTLSVVHKTATLRVDTMQFVAKTGQTVLTKVACSSD